MINIPLILPTVAAMCLILVYIGTHIGAKEHAGWIFSKETLLVIALVIVLFCIGLDGQGIWRMLTSVAHR